MDTEKLRRINKFVKDGTKRVILVEQGSATENGILMHLSAGELPDSLQYLGTLKGTPETDAILMVALSLAGMHSKGKLRVLYTTYNDELMDLPEFCISKSIQHTSSDFDAVLRAVRGMPFKGEYKN
jgi:hypothetical protein